MKKAILTQQFTTSYKKVKQLLSKGNTNAKTVKNELPTYILYLAPANTILTHNLCPFASPGCKSSCLYSAGRGRFNNVQQSRINKAKFWAYDRAKFYAQLANELQQLEKRKTKIAVRLNGTSDIDHIDLLYRYTGINFLYSKYLVFYDYTKNFNVYKKYLNTNYKLTFSMSETNFDQVHEVLKMGGNVAAVFRNSLPSQFMGFDVINGDLTDLRINDPRNIVVGLIAKGDAKKDKTGFVINN
jgi:hypothetical protein